MSDQEQKVEETSPSETGEAQASTDTAELDTEHSASADNSPVDEGADPQEGEPAEAGSEPSLEETISRLEEDLAAARDAALRAQADAQNVKRRAEQDADKARKFALEGFSKDLLPVVDNLERALESVDADDEAMKGIVEGIQLTLKSFLDVMKKYNIEQIDPVGEPFDPNLHQAMSMVENPDLEPNSVIAVVQKGYTLSGRLVRPAMVMVSKAAG
ncbi:MAG: nucleotide exchange factor GrpE [Pseudomonadota bacterium]